MTWLWTFKVIFIFQKFLAPPVLLSVGLWSGFRRYVQGDSQSLRFLFLFMIYLSGIQCSVCMCAWRPGGGARSHYRWSWATVWVLGIELWTPRRVASALNCWVISPALVSISNPWLFVFLVQAKDPFKHESWACLYWVRLITRDLALRKLHFKN